VKLSALTIPLLALFATVPALAGPIDLTYVAQPTIVTTQNPSLPIYAAPPGVGYDRVVGLLITKPSGTSLCTGSLFGTGHSHVVTAAHCLQGATSIDSVFFPSGGGTVIVTSTAYTINPGYTGSVIDENDVGVISLGASVNQVDSYSLFTGDAVGQVFDMVGFGESGTGATGMTLPSGLRRHGNNRFDFSGTDPVFSGFWGDQDILFADFDDGTAAHDATCNFMTLFTLSTAYCDLGLGDFEVLNTPGDSGGPLFVGGKIAAVASFGLTFTDMLVGDVDDTLNSSFGEFGGYVPIAAQATWLQGQVVPEPTTIIPMITGLLGITIMRRRRAFP